MNDLKSITLDAARYRWIREHYLLVEWHEFFGTDGDERLDGFIDAQLESV